MTYKEYLQSPHWLSLRARKLKEAGEQCNRCGALNMLEVHHIYYGKSWFRTELKHLEVLCSPCHELHHKNFKKHPKKPIFNGKMKHFTAFRNPFKGPIDRAVVGRY